MTKKINGESVENYTFLFWGAVPYEAEQKRSRILIESLEQLGFRLYKKSPLKPVNVGLMEILYVFHGNLQQIQGLVGVQKDASMRRYKQLDNLCSKSGVLLLSCNWFSHSQDESESDD